MDQVLGDIFNSFSDSLELSKHEKIGLYGFPVGLFLFFVAPSIAAILFTFLAIFFMMAGGDLLFATGEEEREFTSSVSQPIQPTSSAPITTAPTIADRIKEIHGKNSFNCPTCGATASPTDIRCSHCNSILVEMVDLPRPVVWGDVEIGHLIRYIHPTEGEKTETVLGRIYYGELWQERMRPDVPWTLTGGYFVGLFVKSALLLNWQSRYFLLDVKRGLTDMEINRAFAIPARKFGNSNQTENASVSYNGRRWELTDIGRFRVEYAEGERAQSKPGAIGRFIHAKHKNQALVLEDFQSGGSGQDMVWLGYEIEEKDIVL